MNTSGKVTPIIDRTYLSSDVPDALRYLETGRARGRIVITLSAEAALTSGIFILACAAMGTLEA